MAPIREWMKKEKSGGEEKERLNEFFENAGGGEATNRK